ncbi:MAG TPA: prepilin-type N-terminal cleavage/methylation domain-containing protein, partial [Methylococcaceae bacterium]|nr:prepilin-type N-terminal cleavage/methylation domain-containing protein [Methylococcaceae bacterium]
MNNKQFSGFSLTELLVVIALIGIIASIAIPSFQGMIEKNRLKAAIESLAADL